MLEVTQIGAGFFCDKSGLEEGMEFIGLINIQGKLESALFNKDINLTRERKIKVCFNNKFSIHHISYNEKK